MDAFVLDRADGRDDGEDWTENYEGLPGSASISIIFESTTKAGVRPRLHLAFTSGGGAHAGLGGEPKSG